jgi:hypothetical protein
LRHSPDTGKAAIRALASTSVGHGTCLDSLPPQREIAGGEQVLEIGTS